MPYLDVAIIKSSLLTKQEKEAYTWYFIELSNGYYAAAPGSHQELLACRWVQELAVYFWADVHRVEQMAKARLNDNLAQMMTVQLNVDSEEREEEKRRLREIHEALAAGSQENRTVSGRKVTRGKFNEYALSASHWS